MTNAEAWFNTALRPWKPEGSLGRAAQDGHLDSHTAPELSDLKRTSYIVYTQFISWKRRCTTSIKRGTQKNKTHSLTYKLEITVNKMKASLHHLRPRSSTWQRLHLPASLMEVLTHKIIKAAFTSTTTQWLPKMAKIFSRCTVPWPPKSNILYLHPKAYSTVAVTQDLILDNHDVVMLVKKKSLQL